jgi:hypothetical protein
VRSKTIRILETTKTTSADHSARSKLCALAIMAKAPRPGTVKTRLSPPLAPEQATALSICFLRDTAENITAVAAQVSGKDRSAAALIAYTPVGDETLFDGLLPDDFALIAQRGDGFGERLLAAANDILHSGYGSVCLIDSDSPTLPPQAYEQAVGELARPGDRIVLGATTDGGYYLIGLKQPHAAVFDRIRWSTETVFAETCERAREAAIEVVELPLWYDVDDGPTLEILKAELLAGMAPGFATLPGYPAQHTKQFLLAQDLALNAAFEVKPPDPLDVDQQDADSQETAE